MRVIKPEEICGRCGSHIEFHDPTTLKCVIHADDEMRGRDWTKTLKYTFKPWVEATDDYVEHARRKLENMKMNKSSTLPSSPAKRATLCECGAHAIGVPDKSFGHSSWCPARS